MPYFTYFPSISYTTDPEDLTKIVVVKDITVRAKINEYFKNSALTSLPYEIQDGERPESLAHRVYERSDLHWLILMFNEIHDPTFEWPLSTAELESKLEAKYKGYALYYPDTSRVPDAFQDQDTLQIKNAKTVSQTLEDGRTVTANIVKWDPTYNCIVVEGDEAYLFDPYSDSPLFSDTRAWIYFDDDTSKAIVLTKVVEHQYALNHFEDSDGNILDPRFIPAQGNNLQQSVLSAYVSDVENQQAIAIPINNRTHEIMENDKKRLIRMVKPEFMSGIITQFRSLFE